jgi:hypothetical protein
MQTFNNEYKVKYIVEENKSRTTQIVKRTSILQKYIRITIHPSYTFSI